MSLRALVVSLAVVGVLLRRTAPQTHPSDRNAELPVDVAQVRCGEEIARALASERM